MEDIINIYGLLDVKKIKLPPFLAADCCRLPTMKDIETGKLTSRIDEIRTFLSTEMNTMSMKFSSSISDLCIANNRVIDDMKSSMSNVTAEVIDTINSTSKETKSSVSSVCSSAVAALSASTNEMKSVIDKQSIDVGSVSTVVDEFKAATKQAESYAEKILSSSIGKAQDASSWFTVVNGKPRLLDSLPQSSTGLPSGESNRRKITGCVNSDSLKIKSSRVNSSSWHVFVGKVDPGTTEQEINDYLTDQGISVVSVVKLRAVQKWQEKSAAFKVSINESNKCDIMKPDIWPVHAEVRDWFFKPRSRKHCLILLLMI